MATNLIHDESANKQPGVSNLEKPASNRPEPLEDKLEKFSHANSYIFKLPVLRKFKDSYVDEFRSLVRDQIEQFKSLKCIDEQEKEHIFPQIKLSLARIYSYEAWWKLEDKLYTSLAIIWAIGLVIALLGSIYWLFNKLHIANWWVVSLCAIIIPSLIVLIIRQAYQRNKIDTGKELVGYLVIFSIIIACVTALWIQFDSSLTKLMLINSASVTNIILVIAIILFFFSMLVLYSIIGFNIGAKSSFQGVLFIVVSITLMYWLIATSANWFSVILRDALIAFLATANVSALLIIFISSPVSLLHEYIKRSKASKYPEDEITESLCSNLTYIERNPEKWKYIEFRADIVQRLTWIEKIIRLDFYKLLVADNNISKSWVLDFVNEASTVFIQIAREVILSDDNTRDNLIKRLSQNLIHAANRNWGKLERQKTDSSLSWQSRVVSLTLSTIRVVTPFLFLVGVKSIPQGLIDAQTQNSIITAIISFAILNILYVLNPKLIDLPSLDKPKINHEK